MESKIYFRHLVLCVAAAADNHPLCQVQDYILHPMNQCRKPWDLDMLGDHGEVKFRA